jgi:hypothetical protein
MDLVKMRMRQEDLDSYLEVAVVVFVLGESSAEG